MATGRRRLYCKLPLTALSTNLKKFGDFQRLLDLSCRTSRTCASHHNCRTREHRSGVVAITRRRTPQANSACKATLLGRRRWRAYDGGRNCDVGAVSTSIPIDCQKKPEIQKLTPPSSANALHATKTNARSLLQRLNGFCQLTVIPEHACAFPLCLRKKTSALLTFPIKTWHHARSHRSCADMAQLFLCVQ